MNAGYRRNGLRKGESERAIRRSGYRHTPSTNTMNGSTFYHNHTTDQPTTQKALLVIYRLDFEIKTEEILPYCLIDRKQEQAAAQRE